MRNLNVYVDESGNTGDVAGEKSFAEQSVFALAGVAEPREADVLARVVADFRARHKLQGTEIKWKSLRRRPRIVHDLLTEASRAGAAFFVELMDKHYFIATNIVSYVLLGCAITPGPIMTAGPPGLPRALAALITEVGVRSLRAYARFASEPTQATFAEFEESFRLDLFAAKWGSDAVSRFASLAAVEELFAHSLGLAEAFPAHERLQHLVPPADKSVGGHRLALLPQVFALSNLCARLNRFAGDRESVTLHHDQQLEFEGLLREYHELVTSNLHSASLTELAMHERVQVDWNFRPDWLKLKFVDSEATAGIQVADVVAGFCASRLHRLVSGERVEEGFDAVADMLRDPPGPPGLLGVNVVSTDHRLDGFYGQGEG